MASSWIVALSLIHPVHAAMQFEETTTNGEFENTESWGASWGYINDDLYPDLFVVNHRSRVNLYRNNGDGTFTSVILPADQSRTWHDKPLTDTHGTAFADVDGDGDQDLVSQTGACCDAALMINDGWGRFTNMATAYGMNDDKEGRTPHWVDYDNDGTLDLWVTSGTTRLYRNDGVLPWSDRARTTLFGAYCSRNQWAMITNMDANTPGMEYICANEGDFPELTLNYSAPFDTFNVNSYLPSSSISNATDAVAADFTADLKPDLFIARGALMPNQAKLFGTNRVEGWMYTGVGFGERRMTFTATGQVTFKTHSNQVGFSNRVRIGASGFRPQDDGGNPMETEFTLDSINPAHEGLYGDFKSEEWADSDDARGFFVGHDGNNNWTMVLSPGNGSVRGYFTADAQGTISNFPDTITGVAGSSLRDEAMLPGLLINTGTGFTSNEFDARVSPPTKIMCVSVVAADFDNDMDLDLYLVCRGGIENIANKLYENDGTGRFTEVSNHGAEGGVGAGLASGWGTGENVVTADYDLDGRVDLFVTNGIVMQPFLVGGQDQLFRNTVVNQNNWTQFSLRGTSSNIEGVGAQIKITAGGVTQLREQNEGMHRWSQNLKRIHVGLGVADAFDVQITWPSGIVDNHKGLTANRFYDFTEGDDSPPLPLNVGPAIGPAPLAAGDECGAPAYADRLDAGKLVYLDLGLFVHKDCGATDGWTIEFVGGRDRDGDRDPTSVRGQVQSSLALTDTMRANLEQGDIWDTSVAKQIDFQFNVTAGSYDTGGFKESDGAVTCLDLAGTTMPVYLGARHAIVPTQTPLNLSNILAPNECQNITAPRTLSVDDVTLDESLDVAQIQVNLSEAVSTDVTVVLFSRSDGTASEGQDFYGFTQTLTIQAGATSVTAAVTILDDLVAEIDETFSVRLVNAVGADIADGVATVTIADNDTDSNMPTLAIADASVDESGAIANVELSLSSPSDTDVTALTFSQATGTATSGQDFYGFTRPVTIPAGDTQASVPVTILNDSNEEDDETFRVRVINASGANIIDNLSTVTIIDDDGPSTTATLSIDSTVVSEGDGQATLTVTLSQAADASVTVFTRPGTATGRSQDYYGFTRVVTFAAGVTQQQVPITLVDDALTEQTEVFTVNLLNAVGAQIATSQGEVAIIDDD